MIRERFPNSQIVNNVRVDAKTKSKMFSSRVGLFTSRVKKLSRTMSNSRVLFAELFSARVFCWICAEVEISDYNQVIPQTIS